MGKVVLWDHVEIDSKIHRYYMQSKKEINLVSEDGKHVFIAFLN